PRLFFARSGAHRSLPSFPTRRSSDLADPVWRRRRPPPPPSAPTDNGPERHQSPTAATTRPAPASPRHTNGDCTENAQTQAEASRSEEHTSELQSRENLVCRLLLEKKN